MELWEIQREINRAKQTIRNADDVAGDIAEILPGRLRHVSGSVLAKLKRELRDFDSRSFEWRDK